MELKEVQIGWRWMMGVIWKEVFLVMEEVLIEE
jgi:hypothetical protein